MLEDTPQLKLATLLEQRGKQYHDLCARQQKGEKLYREVLEVEAAMDVLSALAIGEVKRATR
jgi:hypothetical protein